MSAWKLVRAMCMPRHRCGPTPKATCWLGLRSRITSSGSANCVASRFAESQLISTRSPARRRCPPSSVSTETVLLSCSFTVKYRRNSSVAGDSRLGCSMSRQPDERHGQHGGDGAGIVVDQVGPARLDLLVDKPPRGAPHQLRPLLRDLRAQAAVHQPREHLVVGAFPLGDTGARDADLSRHTRDPEVVDPSAAPGSYAD